MLATPRPPGEPAPRWLRTPAALWAAVFAAVLLAGAVFATGHVQTQPADAPEGVREVVQLQLQALQADDAGRAFALADPDIRSRFGTAQEFLDMVREQYPMVHRPASVLFLKPESEGNLAFQKVRLTDAAGGAWVVTYLLNKQQDHQWRISACLVAPDTPRVRA